LTAFLNEAHRQILSIPGFDRLRDDTVTFASVNGRPVYGLPPVIERIETITDRTTPVLLKPMTLADLRAGDPGLVNTGVTYAYVNLGWQQVATQPTSTGLWAVSSAAGDTTQTVTIETVRSGGYRGASTNATLNGVTRVQIGSLTDHVEVDKFYLSATAAGAISLYDAAAAGNELARIEIGRTYARYLAVQLWPTPSSAITYYVDYVRTIPDMANATDEPLLPEDFHWLLIEAAMMKEYMKADDSRATQAEREYLKGLSQLKYFMSCPPDFLPSPLRGRPQFSRLGANFPATRW
jgi:hypothetical protein